MNKLLDILRLRKKGLSWRKSFILSIPLNSVEKACLTFVALAVPLVYFSQALAYYQQEEQNAYLKQQKEKSQYATLQKQHEKLERVVVSILNGEPTKIGDAYFKFKAKIDDSIN